MGFASDKYQHKRDERPWTVHPIWRGIGCFLIILIPLMAWAGAELFMQTNQVITLPPELYQPVKIPLSPWGFVNTVLVAIDNFLSSWRLTYGVLIFTVAFLVVGYGLLSVLYGIIYRLFGPARYSEVDARPSSIPRRRR